MKFTIAKILSVALHPLLVPSYLAYGVCYQLPGVLATAAVPRRAQLLGLVALLTFGVPVLGVLGLLWAGVVNSLEMPDRRQRTWPLLLAAASFAAAAGLLHRLGPAAWPLPRMLAGMALAVLLTLLITLRWKISAHSVGMGGAVGLLALLHLGPHSSAATLSWLEGSAGLAAAVGWARLALRAHTPAQVWAGLALGVGVAVALGGP